MTEIYYGALHDKQESMFLYSTVKEKVNALSHVIAIRSGVKDLINISIAKGFHRTLHVTN